jgi:hypothetical protein
MTKEEVIKILVQIEAVYSYCMTKDETVTYWFEFCQVMNYKKVLAKLQAHIRKSPYPPVIADLAVFTTEESEFQEKLERWIEEGMQRLERNRRNANLKQIPAWMLEYSPRPASAQN